MMDLLGDLDYVIVYIDDILLLKRHGKTEEEHLKKIKVVLKRLNDIGFRANLSKVIFHATRGRIPWVLAYHWRYQTTTKESRSFDTNQTAY